MAGAPQQLGHIGIHSGLEHSVLVSLRGGQLQRLILILQSTDVVLVQSVQNRSAVGVGVVNNVPGGVLDGVLGGRSAGGDVVPHALDGALGLAAAGSELGSQSVEALLGLVAKLAHGGVNPVEAVGHSVLDGGLAVLETVQSEALVQIGTGDGPLGIGGVEAAAVAAAETTAETAVTPAAKKYKKQKPGHPVAAPAIAEAAVIALIDRSHRHGHHSAVIGKRHSMFLL